MDSRLNRTGWGELPKTEISIPQNMPEFKYDFCDLEEVRRAAMDGIKKSRIRDQRRRARTNNAATVRALFIGLWVMLLFASIVIGGLQ